MNEQISLPKPLSEGALAEVTEGMRLLHAAERRIDASLGALQHCRVPVDVHPFKKLSECLDEAYAHLGNVVSAHIDAIDAQRKGRVSK